jgi:hypothetical protein
MRTEGESELDTNTCLAACKKAKIRLFTGIGLSDKKFSIWLVLIRLIYHDIKIEEHFHFSTQTLWENFKESLYHTSLSVI